jgi:hypothetical protein
VIKTTSRVHRKVRNYICRAITWAGAVYSRSCCRGRDKRDKQIASRETPPRISVATSGVPVVEVFAGRKKGTSGMFFFPFFISKSCKSRLIKR